MNKKVFVANKRVLEYQGKDRWTELTVIPLFISLSKKRIEDVCESLYTGEKNIGGETYLEEFHIHEQECEINFSFKEGERIFSLVSRNWHTGFDNEPGWECIEYLLFSKSQVELEAKKEEVIREKFTPILQEVSEEFGVEIPFPSIERQESILNSREGTRLSIEIIEVV